MCFGGGKGGDGGAAEAQRKREATRRANITRGTAAIDSALSPFNDEYFNTRQTAYVNNAMPQLNSSFDQAQKDLVYALSRSGLLQSSEAANRQRLLNEERAKYEREIQNGAASFANQGRTGLEQTRAQLLSQLNATEDPTSAATAAANQAQLLQAPPSFDPLGNFAFNTAVTLQNLSNSATRGRGFLAGSPAASISSGSGVGSSSITRV